MIGAGFERSAHGTAFFVAGVDGIIDWMADFPEIIPVAETFVAVLARDPERCVIARAAISRELSEPLDFVTETKLEAHAIGT